MAGIKDIVDLFKETAEAQGLIFSVYTTFELNKYSEKVSTSTFECILDPVSLESTRDRQLNSSTSIEYKSIVIRILIRAESKGYFYESLDIVADAESEASTLMNSIITSEIWEQDRSLNNWTFTPKYLATANRLAGIEISFKATTACNRERVTE